jgi:hypothetical protein
MLSSLQFRHYVISRDTVAKTKKFMNKIRIRENSLMTILKKDIKYFFKLHNITNCGIPI